LDLRRRSPFALFITLAMTAGAPVHVAYAQAPAASPVPNAQAEIAAGDKAARAKDWQGALDHYQASYHATASWRAQLGVADALYQLGRLGESYDQYDDAQKTYGTKYGPGEKNVVNARLKDLTTKTGWLSLRVTEPGADVAVDGKSIGTSPVPALIRVAVGSHDVKVTKTGFVPFSGHAEVAADGKAVVDAPIAPEAKTGHVVVHAAGPEVLRVTIDGVDVGATPWEGDLPPGPHQLGGRSSTAASTAQAINVTVGTTSAFDLSAASTVAHIQVRTNDGKGNIYVDSVIKGEGAFSGDVPAGPHTIVVSREGYERFEKSITLGPNETSVDTVSLKPIAAAGGVVKDSDRPYQGVYGGFGFLFMDSVSSQGTELDTNCDTLGADSCQTASPVGGGGFGYVGYTWDPVGFELMIGGGGDTMQEKATFSNTTSTTAALPMASPGRVETFTFVRGGGLGALRARASFQTSWVRGTIAGGLGVSYHEVIAKRDAVRSSSGGSSSLPSEIPYVPDPVGYLSPALSIEAAAQFRVSSTIGISVGVEMWADSASIAGKNTSAGGPLQPFDVTQPPAVQYQYHLASGPQVMIGPFLGMHFGP
jgi:hypothetical protein